MKPTGYKYLTGEEIENIERLRKREYTIEQIVNLSGRSMSTVKRIIYKWPSQAKVIK
tara:strand:- start:1599 stop:1769 length:171 start_codon:yes stop_codon:yes gene_type:complete